MRYIEYIISTIAPHECVGCGQEGSLLCGACMRTMPRIPSRCYRCQRLSEDFGTCKTCRSSSQLFSVCAQTPYQGLTKDLLWKLKYERAQDGAKTLAWYMAEQLADLADMLVTHVPTVNARVRMRGYDQAQLMAKDIGLLKRALYIPLLVRVSDSRQVGHGRQERKSQMASAFITTRERELQDKHILLVDDVITTGATLEAAATVLKKAGAKRVSAVVFAAA